MYKYTSAYRQFAAGGRYSTNFGELEPAAWGGEPPTSSRDAAGNEP